MSPTTDLDARGLLDRASAALRARRAAEVDDLVVALAWADLHGEAPAVETPGGDRLVQLGGEGTPRVRDLCLEELSLARQTHAANTRAVVADALDLRHRLPKIWSVVQRLECETWVARRIARMSRQLSARAVGLVDETVAAALHESPRRVLAIAEARIIEADTELHEQHLAAKARQRGVWLGRIKVADPDDPDSGPIQSIYAKITPAGAHFVDDQINQIAQRLADDPALRARHHPDLPESPSRDQLRAAAFEWLARPEDILALLDSPQDGGDDADAAADADADAGETAPTRRRRQKAVVYVHLHEASLLDGQGVARAEAIGPVLLTHLRNLLGHTHIDLKPVIDLAETRSVNGYEHPADIRERTRLRLITGDVFPYAISMNGYLSGHVDHDHPIPYDRDGPPGQTGDHNIAPLSRRSHRAKTHLTYQVEQLGLGRYLWRTPHGLWHLTDPTGSRALTDTEARLLRTAHQRRNSA